MIRPLLGAGGALAAAGAVAASRWALPADPLPEPTGPHPVGTTTGLVHGPRRLPVQVWYPAVPDRGAGDGGRDRDGQRDGRAPLFADGRGAARAITARYPLPAWALAGLGRVRGRAVADADPERDALRGVVVVSHGWLGWRSIHADLAEELASRGWAVLAPDHVGGALVSQYPGGGTVGLTPELMPPDGHPDHGPRTVALVDRYADDLSAVVEAVVAGTIAPWLPPTAAVRLLGHSTGGGAAVRVGARDDRVTGIVGLDPWVEPVHPSPRRRLRQPMVAVRSGPWVGGRNDGLLARMPGVELRAVPEAGHTDLTCLGYLSPVTRLVGLTRCDPDLPHAAALAAFDALPA